MKALTLHQPWASLIADGRKRIETRSRPWYYIGSVAIHAGRQVDKEACLRFGYDPETIPRGAVLGVAYKSDCVRFPSSEAPPDIYGDFTPGRFGYLFTRCVCYPAPIPARGYQGFWEWEPRNG